MPCSLLLLSGLLLVSISSATVVVPEVSASPEPDMVDPIPTSGMSLILVAAGPISGSAGASLGSKATVCPVDYPTGFSVECRSPFPAATFYVNGEGVRKERSLPYYIAGDADGVVRPWNPPSGMSSVTVACKYGGERVRSKISFAC